MDYIRRYYGVPAKRGGRIKFQGKPGVITSAGRGDARLNIRLDGDKHTLPVHPTWEMEYEDAAPDAGAETEGRRTYAIVRGRYQRVTDVYLPEPEET
jgi:hypothetical protein